MMEAIQDLYETYHRDMPFHNFGEYTFQADKARFAYPDATPVLDFGCGNGLAVRRMREDGHPWYGVELSATAFQKHLHEPYFHQGSTEQFEDRRFDLVYSTEVLEHVPEAQVPAVIQDLCRICQRYIFMTISLRPSSQNNRFHCTLRSRAWWQAHFLKHGFVVDRKVVDCFQRRTLRSTTAILRQWAEHGEAPRRFAENPPYRLYGEEEFWYFAFRRQELPPTRPPRYQQRWLRRKVVPLVHRILPIDLWRNAAA